jgi:hypothetical protein
MKITMWTDPEIVHLARAHQLTPARLRAFTKTHSAFLEQEVEGDIVNGKASQRLARIAIAMEPAGATHYVLRFQEGKKDVWKFFVAGDPWVGLHSNCEIPPEELERMARVAREAVRFRKGAIE